MDIKFKKYSSKLGFGEEFEEVRKFFIEVNRNNMSSANFLWARWEWTISLMHFEDQGSLALNKNGLWYDNGKIVAVATNEVSLGKAYLFTLPGYEFLKPEMLNYAKKELQKDGQFKVLIADNDHFLQKEAAKQGFFASQECEKTSAIDISDELTYKLPDGFKIHSLADGYDLRKLDRCTYRGFGNGDEPPEELPEAYKTFEGPNFDESYKIYVEAPNGDYAAYCGMWYDKDTNYAYVEPVCTDPLYRKMGCAKAAVLEAALRCGKFGAKTAYVLASQQFYYSIGFYPVDNYTWWYEKI